MNPTGQRWLATALALVAGGALGNGIDRLSRGYVVDFLDFHWAGHHFPGFNVADMAISLAVGLMLLDMVLQARAQKKQQQQDKA